MNKYLERGYAVDYARLIKAKKIELVLLEYLKSNKDNLSDKKIIDIGCGSGHIAAYFSERNSVWAVDVVDQVSPDIRQKIKFIKIKEDSLPFPDGEFDIAILNHVLAHTEDKLSLLMEVNRLLKKDGICYVANPNKYYPVEPYYKIPFLHYLPQKLFLKLAGYLGRNKEDVYLLSHPSLKKLANVAKFRVTDCTVNVINESEKYSSEYKIPFGIKLPEIVSIISPTNIYILKKSG
ncbi:MAG: class I SAM-dependent methyltransferase [Smithella sp.]|jgi:ubiquinone/menaquinone biosynthesis C-methylase UbiE